MTTHRIALLATTLALAAAAPAPAATVTTDDGTDTGEAVRALDASYMPTPQDATTIRIGTLAPGACANTPTACAVGDLILVRAHPAEQEWRQVLTHELGHVVDYLLQSAATGQQTTAGTSPLRQEFNDTLGKARDAAWDPELFADVWGTCAFAGLEAVGEVTTINYRFKVDKEAFDQSCQLLADATLNIGFDAPTATPTEPVPVTVNWLDALIDGTYVNPAPAADEPAPRARARRHCHRKGSRAHGRRLKRRLCHVHGRR